MLDWLLKASLQKSVIYFYNCFNNFINPYLCIIKNYEEKFEQISIKPGFMKHNGGVLFRTISETEYEFKSRINENHLNAAGITHGGYLSALIDAGAGTAAHRASGNSPCVTISLDLKFIGASKVGDEITGFTKILKKQIHLYFYFVNWDVMTKLLLLHLEFGKF